MLPSCPPDSQSQLEISAERIGRLTNHGPRMISSCDGGHQPGNRAYCTLLFECLAYRIGGWSKSASVKEPTLSLPSPGVPLSPRGPHTTSECSPHTNMCSRAIVPSTRQAATPSADNLPAGCPTCRIVDILSSSQMNWPRSAKACAANTNHKPGEARHATRRYPKWPSLARPTAKSAADSLSNDRDRDATAPPWSAGAQAVGRVGRWRDRSIETTWMKLPG